MYLYSIFDSGATGGFHGWKPETRSYIDIQRIEREPRVKAKAEATPEDQPDEGTKNRERESAGGMEELRRVKRSTIREFRLMGSPLSLSATNSGDAVVGTQFF